MTAVYVKGQSERTGMKVLLMSAYVQTVSPDDVAACEAGGYNPSIKDHWV
jgi:hypothetical protein